MSFVMKSVVFDVVTTSILIIALIWGNLIYSVAFLFFSLLLRVWFIRSQFDKLVRLYELAARRASHRFYEMRESLQAQQAARREHDCD